MKERPILFNTEMVQAILDGRKTQTRREVSHWQMPRETQGPHNEFPDSKWMSVAQKNPRYGFGVFGRTEEECMENYNSQFLSLCPFGEVGDRLWVRETFATLENGSFEPAKPSPGICQDIRYKASEPGSDLPHDIRGFKWRPSIHMPRWASRITLEITDVRIERLQDISEEDAVAEGVAPNCALLNHKECFHQEYKNYLSGDDGDPSYSAKESFQTLWDSIYGNWKENPYVWVVEFKVIKS